MIRARNGFPQSWLSAGALATLAFCAAGRGYATGTAAGTTISNTAAVSYTIGTTNLTTTSNSADVRVAEILDVAVSIQSATVPVASGSTKRALVYRVTNTGNGTEVFGLAADSAIAGDAFDPVLNTPSMYFDTDASGDFSAGDTAYNPGSNDPSLAPDAAVTVFVINDIPTGLADGANGRSRLTAHALTGDGPAGTVFAGQGQGGTDAVTGTSTARAATTGEYVVAQAQVTVVKSQTVVDQFGGARPIPGARINYQLIVQAGGATTALAVVADDVIPANTTYVPGSLTLQSAALTDGVDADAGQFNATPVPKIHVALGDLAVASGSRTVTFSVTIN
jgi:uncharacterized repeat protein (TIGR01451 family)